MHRREDCLANARAAGAASQPRLRFLFPDRRLLFPKLSFFLSSPPFWLLELFVLQVWTQATRPRGHVPAHASMHTHISGARHGTPWHAVRLAHAEEHERATVLKRHARHTAGDLQVWLARRRVEERGDALDRLPHGRHIRLAQAGTASRPDRGGEKSRARASRASVCMCVRARAHGGGKTLDTMLPLASPLLSSLLSSDAHASHAAGTAVA